MAMKSFDPLPDYKNYVKSVAGQQVNTTATGFMEFAPRDPVTQAKYSALSPTWEGVESTEKAVARGDFSLDSAETTRRELRQTNPVKETFAPAPIATSRNCVVQ
jgi:hypothetical protein